MARQSRRNFLASASLLTLGTTVAAAPMKKEKKVLMHQVFFWLKNPDSASDRAKLIEGLQTLKKIEVARDVRIGVPADTEKRPVVDNSYQVSELILFDNTADQKTYQDHPIHVKFVADYSSLWDKVVVYDSMSV